MRRFRLHDVRLIPIVAAVVLVASACAGGSQASPDPSEPLETNLAPGTVPVPATTPVDPYGADPNQVVGTKLEVCRGGEAANRSGRAKLAAHLDTRWPALIEVQGYECREINYPPDPACIGRSEPESSTCWSTHAAGRAIDLLVGGEPNVATPEGAALGDEIVDAFLAVEGGVAHHLARITGVQQILWNGRCWSPKDVDVTAASQMEPCEVTGHANHVHLTLSEAGADGLTSWYADDGTARPGG